MTQSNLGVRAVYSGSGSVGPFSLVDLDTQPIQFEANTELVVTRYNTAFTPSVLTQTTDYTLSGAGGTSAGSLTLVSALTAGFLLTVERATPLTQNLDLQYGGNLTLEELEDSLDKLTRITQDLDEGLNLRPAFPSYYTGDAYLFEEPTDGYLLAWDTSTNMIVGIERPAFILTGAGAPSSSDGEDGDIYLDTTNTVLYGPKSGGSWGSGTSLIGPAGSTGATGSAGPQGDPGDDGQTILSGSGAPDSGTGSDGDFYIDVSAYDIYGPKAAGAWGGGTSLVGPSGSGSGDVSGPAGATDNVVVRFDLATGKLIQGSSASISDAGVMTGLASIQVANAGIQIADTGADHYLKLASGENLSADATLSIILSNASRQLTIGGTASISGTAYTSGGTDVSLADGGTGASLSDPGGDRIMFWDDSATSSAWLDIGTGLAISGTTISLSHLGLESLSDPSADRIIFWDDSATATAFLVASTGLQISTTDLSLTDNMRDVGIPIIIDGGGSTITTGVKAYVPVPFNGTITQWELLADQSGSIVVDVWKDTGANHPPTNADTITNSLEPRITSGTRGSSTSLGSWTTTTITKGDILGFNVDSCTAHTRVTVMLYARKS